MARRPMLGLWGVASCGLFLLIAGAVASTTIPTTMDLQSRTASRLWFSAVYPASEGIAAGFTGNVTRAVAGDTSAAFKNAVALRINYIRALAGVPAGVTLNATYNAKAQKAAMMMSANNALSHNPPSSWAGYSADGAEAAGSSNLFLGISGPASVTGITRRNVLFERQRSFFVEGALLKTSRV